MDTTEFFLQDVANNGGASNEAPLSPMIPGGSVDFDILCWLSTPPF